MHFLFALCKDGTLLPYHRLFFWDVLFRSPPESFVCVVWDCKALLKASDRPGTVCSTVDREQLGSSGYGHMRLESMWGTESEVYL
jgi:hypothetical protein